MSAAWFIWLYRAVFGASLLDASAEVRRAAAAEKSDKGEHHRISLALNLCRAVLLLRIFASHECVVFASIWFHVCVCGQGNAQQENDAKLAQEMVLPSESSSCQSLGADSFVLRRMEFYRLNPWSHMCFRRVSQSWILMKCTERQMQSQK